jgi:ribosomal-protein-alanine N-acetyltransferase
MNPTLKADIVIRRVGLNRIDDLLALEYNCFSCDRISRRNLRNLLLSPSACCLAAYHGGELVGSMVVLFRSTSRVARIYSLAVATTARGMGVGRRMMARAEKEARARGCDRLRLEVRMDNLPAIRLYEGLGFTDTRVIPGYYEDGTHAMVYRKELI